MKRTALLVAAGALVMGAAARPVTAEATTYSRMYLLASDADYLYWSADPADPELPVSRITRTCGPANTWGTATSRPCLTGPPLGGRFMYTHFFLPATELLEPISWSASAPLRFHVEMDLRTVAPATVFFTVDNGKGLIESEPASEVAPGVFEATLTRGSPIDPSVYTMFSIRVRTPSPHVTFDIAAAGRSWVELPSPVAARTVPTMLRETPAAVDGFATQTARFRFTDAQWQAWEFAGDLTQRRVFRADSARDPEAVFAWVEAYDTPLVWDLARGKEPETGKLTETPMIALLHDGEVVGHGSNGEVLSYRGADFVGTGALDAGRLEIDIEAFEGGAAMPYRAYILAVYGDRTLGAVRWRFSLGGDFVGMRSAMVAVCPAGAVPFPATGAATSLRIDVDWDHVGPTPQTWTPRFTLPGIGELACGEGGVGDVVRLTWRQPFVWWVGVTPPQHNNQVSYRDVIFEVEGTFAYATA